MMTYKEQIETFFFFMSVFCVFSVFEVSLILLCDVKKKETKKPRRERKIILQEKTKLKKTTKQVLKLSRLLDY